MCAYRQWRGGRPHLCQKSLLLLTLRAGRGGGAQPLLPLRAGRGGGAQPLLPLAPRASRVATARD
jgi:hypothetical protein